MDAETEALVEEVRAARAVSDFLRVERLGRDLVRLGEERDARDAVAAGHYHVAVALTNLNRTGEAIRASRSAIQAYDELGDDVGKARATMILAAIAIDHDIDVGEARQYFEASLPALRASGKPINMAIALGNLGEIYRLEGDYKAALRSATDALASCNVDEDSHLVAWLWSDIAHYYLMMRNVDQALAAMESAYAALLRNPNARWVAWFLDVWFLVAAKAGNLEVAAQVLAFADKIRDDHNQPRSPAMLPWFSEPRERLARELGHARLEELVLSGESLTLQSAHRLAKAAFE
ncbi:MAG: tetratricopeptide repeat protein [Candidatus Eremiobacteraeota bacterium]|nr:tetratricopeptide repeat protein [Candidatus Eremiobacteraeota bacterium]